MRYRRQFNPCRAEETFGEVTVINGRLIRGLKWHLCSEDHEMIRQGYKCVNCMEVMPQSIEPFPEACPLCGFNMKEDQMLYYEQTYIGEEPKTFDIDKEFERMEEERERREAAERLQIWVPNAPPTG